jgi:hypothetical protein
VVTRSGVRITELLAALSFGADLGLGHPTEHVLHQTYIALHLAERLELVCSEPHRKKMRRSPHAFWRPDFIAFTP